MGLSKAWFVKNKIMLALGVCTAAIFVAAVLVVVVPDLDYDKKKEETSTAVGTPTSQASTATSPVPTTGPTPTTDPNAMSYKNWRLPYSDLTDIQYTFATHVDLRDSMVNSSDWEFFIGSSTVAFSSDEVAASGELVIHSTVEVLESPTWNGIEVTETVVETEYQYLILKRPDAVDATSTTHKIEFPKFKGPLDGLSGIYRSSYTDATGKTVHLLTSQIQSTAGRRTFPQFEEPAFKAKINTTACWTTDDPAINYIANSNMPAIDTSSPSTNTTCTVFKNSPFMSTYLFALTITDFEAKTVNALGGGSYSLSVLARPASVTSGLVDFAASITPDLVAGFEDYYATPYPLDKCDQLAIPDFAWGAMENWGLILYRETALLFDETMDSEAARRYVALVVAHELAHQWFGNLVTISWWNETFLNEGFASFTEIQGFRIIKNVVPYDLTAYLMDELHASAMSADGVATSRPIIDPNVFSPSDIDGTFDAISYSKGGSILAMLYRVLGDEIYKEGLRAYLDANQYGTATYTMLFEQWQRVVDAAVLTPNIALPVNTTLLQVFDAWLVQAGYPLVTLANCTADSTKWCATQKRFLYIPDDAAFVDYRWYVPLNMKWQGGNGAGVNMVWMDPDVNEVVLGDKAFGVPILNKNSDLMYRVHYAEMVDIVVNEASDYHVRAALIRDLNALNSAGLGGIEQLYSWIESTLAMSNMTATENIAIHLETAMNAMGKYMDLSIHAAQNQQSLTAVTMQSELQADIQAKIMSSFTQNSGMDASLPKPSTRSKDGEQALFQATIAKFACDQGLQSCVDAVDAYATGVTDGSVSLEDFARSYDPNLKAATYCSMVRTGGEDMWNKFSQYHASKTCEDNSQERSLVRLALSCSNNETILSDMLDLLFDENFIREQDAFFLLGNIAANAGAGSKIAWPWLKNNFVKYGDYLTYRRAGTAIQRSTQYFSTQTELDDMQAFYGTLDDEHKEKVEVYYNKAVTAVQANIQWRETYELQLLDILQS